MLRYGLPLGFTLLVACAGPDAAGDDPLGEASQALAHDRMVLQALIVETALLDDSVDRAALAPDSPGGWWLPRPLYKMLLRHGLSAQPGCVRSSPWVDADGDGLPADTNSVVACEGKLDGGRMEAIGEVHIHDLDDAAPHAGYRVAFRDLTIREVFTAASLERTVRIDGFATVKARDAFESGAVDRNLELVLETRIGEHRSQRALTMYTDTEYKPAPELARADPFARGTLRLRGRWTLDANDRVSRMTVWAAPALYYTRACAEAAARGPGFVRGEIHTADDWQVAMDLRFSGCGRWTADYESGD